jgi:L-threonylcarbamoyladenylate synthase
VDEALVAAAIRELAGGGVVAYPTETVYGLGVDARSASAIDRMIELKGREGGRGISVLVTDLAMATPLLAAPPPADAHALVEAFWPGPLTIVLTAAGCVCDTLRGPSGGIGLRCSSDAWAARLVERFGAPVTSTSANRTGQPPARSAGEARSAFDDALYVLDGGARSGTDVSTVVEFAAGRASVLRAGAVPVSAISSVIRLAE